MGRQIVSSYVWNGTTDDWTVAADWTPTGVPGIGDDAAVTAAGTYTLGIAAGETITVDAVTLNAADATLQVDGTLAAGTLEVDAGSVVLGGTIADTTILANGGTIAYNLGTFSNVTFQGVLSLGDNGLLLVQNGLTVTDAAGTGPGEIDITGGGSAALIFTDAETVDNVTINVGSDIGFNALNVNASGASLVFGAGVVINSVGVNGLQLGGGAAIISSGTINAGVAGGQAFISSTSFTNAGALNVTGGQVLTVQSPDFANTGTVFVDVGSEVDFQGTTIAAAQASGGTVDIEGTVDAGGATIDLGPNSAFADTTLGGTLANAVINSNGGLIAYNFGTLQADTFNGTLALGDNGIAIVTGGLVVNDATGTGPGVIDLTGGGSATLIIGDDETIDNVTINVGSDTGFDALNANGASFVLGPNVTINSVGVNGLQLGGGAAITSNGTINAGVAGGQAFISSTSFTNAGALNVTGGQVLTVQSPDFANTGTVFVDVGSEVDFQGTTIAAAQASGGTVDIEGTVDAGGATIDLGPNSAFANTTLGGTLANAVINSNGGALIANFGTLSASTVNGTLDLGDSGLLVVTGGLTVNNAAGTGPGLIDITGDGSAALIFADSETIDNLTINVGSNVGFDALNANGPTFVLGSNVVVNSVGSNGLQLGGGAAVTNNGRINAAVVGGIAAIDTGTFTNAGTISVAASKQVLSVTSEDGTVVNTGLLSVTNGGTLNVVSNLSGVGRVVVGTRSTAEFGASVAKGQEITLSGLMVNLILDQPASVAAKIRGFTSSDRIDLVGVATIGSTVKAAGSNAVVTGASPTVTLDLSKPLASGKGYGLVSDGQGGSFLITGNVINGPKGGHATITAPMGNALINAQGYGNKITLASCDGVINAGTGGAKVTVGPGNVVINLAGSLNQVTTGNGSNIVKGTTSANLIRLGLGNDQVKIVGSLNAISVGGGLNTVDVTGNVNVITGGYSDDTITVSGKTNLVTLGGGNDVANVSGTSNAVFLGYGVDTVADLGKGLNVIATKSVGNAILTNVASDPSFVLDLVGGAGGYTSAANAYAALQSDGHGGSLLAIGPTGSVDFAGVLTTQLSAKNFAIVPSFHLT